MSDKQSDTVKRYDLDTEESHGEPWQVMNESPLGDWVSYQDYASLQQRLAEVEKEAHLRGWNDAKELGAARLKHLAGIWSGGTTPHAKTVARTYESAAEYMMSTLPHPSEEKKDG